MPSVNLMRKRSKIEYVRNSHSAGPLLLGVSYTKKKSLTRAQRGLPKRSAIRRRHNHTHR